MNVPKSIICILWMYCILPGQINKLLLLFVKYNDGEKFLSALIKLYFRYFKNSKLQYLMHVKIRFELWLKYSIIYRNDYCSRLNEILIFFSLITSSEQDCILFPRNRTSPFFKDSYNGVPDNLVINIVAFIVSINKKILKSKIIMVLQIKMHLLLRIICSSWCYFLDYFERKHGTMGVWLYYTRRKIGGWSYFMANTNREKQK